jgi:sec-independent protein translocase protein TatC
MSNGNRGTIVDPEDMFSDTRMSFGDHLEDLRTHLWRAVKGFFIAMALSLCIGNYVVGFIAAPVENQLQNFYDRQSKKQAADLTEKAKDPNFYTEPRRFPIIFRKNQFRAAVGLPPEPEPVLGATIHGFESMLEKLDVAYLVERKNLDKDSSRVVLDVEITNPEFLIASVRDGSKLRPSSLKTFNVTEAFMVYFKVSLVTGLIIGSPWIFIQIWAFVAAGLYPHEKKLVNYYLPFSIFLFLAGAAVCQFLVIPKAIEVLLSFNEWMGLEPDLRLTEWLSFAMMMPLIFGISFQTPLVMLFMFKIGIVDVQAFRNYRKIAWFLMAIFAAVITPTVDALSMMFLWVPMGFLYELGILMCAWQPQVPFEDVETPQNEEMVEV